MDKIAYKSLKVVHVATYSHGGAGIAAFRIHEALLTAGVDSYFLSLDTVRHLVDSNSTRVIKPTYSYFERGIRKFNRLLRKYINLGDINYRYKLQQELVAIRPSLNCEMASLPFSECDLNSHPEIKAADIIHLHWVAGFLDYPSFFKNNCKPIVWTIHDMNPLQGLFHYEGDGKRNDGIAGGLNKKVTDIKKKSLLQNKKKMAVVSPSHWLFEELKHSNMFKSSEAYCIPNPIDTSVFRIHNNEDLKKQLQIPQNHTVFLFVSQHIQNFRKGFDLLVEALEDIDNPDITLLIIGSSENLTSRLTCIQLGNIYDNEILSKYYSLADAFIIPSREDNLPNVMLESMACGTPVLSFNVGGMADEIKNNFNGLRAINVNADSLKNILKKFIKTKIYFDIEKIRKYALDHFSQKKVANQYLAIYKSLLQ